MSPRDLDIPMRKYPTNHSKFHPVRKARSRRNSERFFLEGNGNALGRGF
jgi:hypothetical protein